MPDIINPSTLEVKGEPVTHLAPMPCVIVAAPVVDADQIISPRNWCTNGDVTSNLNPIPISL